MYVSGSINWWLLILYAVFLRRNTISAVCNVIVALLRDCRCFLKLLLYPGRDVPCRDLADFMCMRDRSESTLSSAYSGSEALAMMTIMRTFP
jgi:hypothetical protein